MEKILIRISLNRHIVYLLRINSEIKLHENIILKLDGSSNVHLIVEESFYICINNKNIGLIKGSITIGKLTKQSLILKDEYKHWHNKEIIISNTEILIKNKNNRYIPNQFTL